MVLMEDIHSYNYIVRKMRDFFQKERGFIEVPTQSRLSILAACEDPKTITKFNFDGVEYPLPQTGQMWLEYELLKNPDEPGVFCISTSYRNEPNPIANRHKKIFPMFEFESHGTMDELMLLETELLDYLKLGKKIHYRTYDGICKMYGTKTIEAEHEEKLHKQISDCVFIKYFPQRSNPFWNMKQNDTDKNLYNKVDVILHGQETIGSAERSCNAKEMYDNFLSLSDGEYSQLLFNKFSEERVMRELENYLNLDFFPRFGGGIGLTRMARALKMSANKETVLT